MYFYSGRHNFQNVRPSTGWRESCHLSGRLTRKATECQAGDGGTQEAKAWELKPQTQIRSNNKQTKKMNNFKPGNPKAAATLNYFESTRQLLLFVG